MAGKTAPSHVWKSPIKAIGNGWIKLIAKCVDIGVTTLWQGQGLEIHATVAQFGIFTSGQPDWQTGISVAEDIVDNDLYCLVKKKGAEILHNQKLAAAYGIGIPVYKTAAGTWTQAKGDVPAALLSEVGIICGPADRYEGAVLRDIDVAFTATEPVDICL